MHRIFLMGLLVLTGCQSTRGPLDVRRTERVDDPTVDLREQQRRGRDQLALPFDNGDVAPRTRIEFPGPHGR